MAEGGSEDVRKRKNYGKRTVDNRFPQKVTPLYVSNLPEGISDERFQEAFKKFGSLTDSYLSWREIKGIDKLQVELNSIKLDGVMLGVNIARFNKNGKRSNGPSPPVQRFSDKSQRNVHGSTANPKVFTSNSQRGSFKDVLMGQSLKKRINLSPIDPVIPKWWKGYSLIGITKDLEILDIIVESLEYFGSFGGIVRYVGGLTVFISFSSSLRQRNFCMTIRQLSLRNGLTILICGMVWIFHLSELLLVESMVCRYHSGTRGSSVKLR
ncbi:hypothetical protein R6Q57_021129 [Mikania cordata]